MFLKSAMRLVGSECAHTAAFGMSWTAAAVTFLPSEMRVTGGRRNHDFGSPYPDRFCEEVTSYSMRSVYVRWRAAVCVTSTFLHTRAHGLHAQKQHRQPASTRITSSPAYVRWSDRHYWHAQLPVVLVTHHNRDEQDPAKEPRVQVPPERRQLAAVRHLPLYVDAGCIAIAFPQVPAPHRRH